MLSSIPQRCVPVIQSQDCQEGDEKAILMREISSSNNTIMFEESKCLVIVFCIIGP